MSGILFGVNFIGKHNDDCFTSGSVKYLSEKHLILDVNNEGFEIKIDRDKINEIKLLRKNRKM